MQNMIFAGEECLVTTETWLEIRLILSDLSNEVNPLHCLSQAKIANDL